MRPVPVRSCRNFGDADRDSGHSRVPAAAGRHDGPEVLDRRHGGHPRVISLMTDVPAGAVAGLLRTRPRPPAGHLLRRRDRRAGRAVGHDVRQLGGEGRLAARRRARARARQPGAGRPARALARPGGAGRRLGRRARGGVGGRGRRRGDRARTAWTGGPATAARVPVLASALLPLGGAVPRRPARRRPRPRRGGVVAARRVRRVAGRRPDDDPAVAGVTQAELWRAAAAGSHITDGGRLLSETNPASPSGLASFIEPLARSGSMVLVTHVRPGRERIAADERVTHASTRSARQVVAPEPLAEVDAGARKPVVVPWRA